MTISPDPNELSIVDVSDATSPQRSTATKWDVPRSGCGVGVQVISAFDGAPGRTLAMVVVGEVEGRDCILVDDMIDTAGTIAEASKALKKMGARDVYACATHALLSGQARKRLEDSPIKEVAVTNTIAIPEDREFDRLAVLNVGELLAKAVRLTHAEQSVSSLFEEQGVPATV